MKLLKKMMFPMALCIVSFGESGAMEISLLGDKKPLDHAWHYNLKYEDVVGLPRDYNNSAPDSQSYAPIVRVIDGYVNPEVCRAQLTQVGGYQREAGNLRSRGDLSHGTHVSNTILEIAPLSQLTSSSFRNRQSAPKIQKAAKEDSIDVINLSIGRGPKDTNHMSPSGTWYQAILQAAQSGKIIVQAIGNEQLDVPQQEMEKYVAQMAGLADLIAKDPNIKGRYVLVGNVSYKHLNQENIASTSNRSMSHNYDYIVSAPGTDITARTEKNKYESMSGTSMASPGVSGIFARLLSVFKPYFNQAGIQDMGDIRSTIVDLALKNARKVGYYDATKKLPIEFGQGVINYRSAHDAIRTYLFDQFKILVPEGKEEYKIGVSKMIPDKRPLPRKIERAQPRMDRRALVKIPEADEPVEKNPRAEPKRIGLNEPKIEKDVRPAKKHRLRREGCIRRRAEKAPDQMNFEEKISKYNQLKGLLEYTEEKYPQGVEIYRKQLAKIVDSMTDDEREKLAYHIS